MAGLPAAGHLHTELHNLPQSLPLRAQGSACASRNNLLQRPQPRTVRNGGGSPHDPPHTEIAYRHGQEWTGASKGELLRRGGVPLHLRAEKVGYEVGVSLHQSTGSDVH
jgi:hypothetical protein